MSTSRTIAPAAALFVGLAALAWTTTASAIPFTTNDRSLDLTAGSTSLEPTLAGALSSAGYGGGFAATDQSPNALFSPVGDDPQGILLVEYAGYRFHNELGIYNLDGTELVLFEGSDGGGANVLLDFTGNDLLVNGVFSSNFGTSFGFYLRNAEKNFTWYSQDILNEGDRPHFLGYEEGDTLYFGFEDLDLGDHDYNDFIGKVSNVRGTDRTSNPTPEPTGALIFGFGCLVVGSHLRRPRPGS